MAARKKARRPDLIESLEGMRVMLDHVGGLLTEALAQARELVAGKGKQGSAPGTDRAETGKGS